MTVNPTTLPLPARNLDIHVEQAIWERASIRHQYEVEDTPGGPEAWMKPQAAASIWCRVREAVEEAGWKVIPR